MSISQASKQLQQTGKLGWQLVEAARALVAERIHYCRRNSFDAAPIAFERGYGYCQQQAFALVDILTDLGFQAKVVGAFRNRLPTGNIAGHAWVRVTVEGETHDIDTMHYNKKSAKLTFTPLTQVFEYTPLKRVFFGWGSAAVNAYRYYASGVDY